MNEERLDLDTAVGFFDARCGKCNAHIGWSGRYADRPPCQRCAKTKGSSGNLAVAKRPGKWSPEQESLIASLRAAKCPACTKHKSPGKSVCWPCWNRLPSSVRQALYRRVGAGYEEAHAEAMKALGAAPSAAEGGAA